jgi:chromosome segregation ATPase
MKRYKVSEVDQYLHADDEVVDAREIDSAENAMSEQELIEKLRDDLADAERELERWRREAIMWDKEHASVIASWKKEEEGWDKERSELSDKLDLAAEIGRSYKTDLAALRLGVAGLADELESGDKVALSDYVEGINDERQVIARRLHSIVSLDTQAMRERVAKALIDAGLHNRHVDIDGLTGSILSAIGGPR